MDVVLFLQAVAAVILANALCAAFAIGAIACIKQQKKGAADSELSWWIYPCMIAAPATAALGVYLWP